MSDLENRNPSVSMGGDTIINAAQYVRMSTDHQKYSIANQSDAIEAYAKSNNMRIVETFADGGKTGLIMKGREELQRLIDVVKSGTAPFDVILVYDVSRWGRFQNTDEGAYYEQICRNHGIAVHYCGEDFANDGSAGSTIIKTVKRVMAGEYSRELSKKVFAGQCRLIELGYRQGGLCGFGLRRMLVDAAGNPKGILEKGEHKSIQTDRVILVPGPPDEIEVVNRIYKMFVYDQKSEIQIASILNSEGDHTDADAPWTRSIIHQILINEKYIGNNVFNRTSFKLQQARVKNPPEEWVRANGVFEAIVSVALFKQAAKIILDRSKKYTNEEMLFLLKSLYQKKGYLSGLIIDEAEGLPSSHAYSSRFGGLVRAYELVGFDTGRDYRYIEINKYLRSYHAQVISNAINEIENLGATVSHNAQNDLLTINREFTTSIVVARHFQTNAGRSRWKIRFDASLNPTLTLAIRMKEDNQHPLDYYIFPMMYLRESSLRLASENGAILDTFRFDNLDYFFSMTKRAPLSEVA